MSTDVAIEICVSERDLEAAYSLFVETFTEKGLPLISINQFRLSIDRHELVVAKINHELVGFTRFVLFKDGCVSSCILIVGSEYRRKGIGTLLSNYRDRLACGRGAKSIEILVKEGDVMGQLFADSRPEFKLVDRVTQKDIVYLRYLKPY